MLCPRSDAGTTGGTLASAVQFLVKRGADHITCICLIAAPEGDRPAQRTARSAPRTLHAGTRRPGREAQRGRLHHSQGSATPVIGYMASSDGAASSSTGSASIGTALLEKASLTSTASIGHVRQPGRLPANTCCPTSPSSISVERELEHPLRRSVTLAADRRRPLQRRRSRARRAARRALTTPIAVHLLGGVASAEEEDLPGELLPDLAGRGTPTRSRRRSWPTSASVCLKRACSATGQRQVADHVQAVPATGRPAGDRRQITTFGMKRISRCTSRMCSRPAGRVDGVASHRSTRTVPVLPADPLVAAAAERPPPSFGDGPLPVSSTHPTSGVIRAWSSAA